MKKKILTIIAGTMFATSIGFAAPITELHEGETNVGYSHYNLDINGHNVKSDSFYLENAISDKFILGIERNGYAFPYPDSAMTDVYAHYKVDPNIRFIVGNRNYSEGTDKFFYGVGANVNLAPKIDGYMSVTASNIATEWQTGVTYKMNDQTSLQLGYKSYKEDYASTLDGIGFGINCKF